MSAMQWAGKMVDFEVKADKLLEDDNARQKEQEQTGLDLFVPCVVQQIRYTFTNIAAIQNNINENAHSAQSVFSFL